MRARITFIAKTCWRIWNFFDLDKVHGTSHCRVRNEPELSMSVTDLIALIKDYGEKKKNISFLMLFGAEVEAISVLLKFPWQSN